MRLKLFHNQLLINVINWVININCDKKLIVFFWHSIEFFLGKIFIIFFLSWFIMKILARVKISQYDCHPFESSFIFFKWQRLKRLLMWLTLLISAKLTVIYFQLISLSPSVYVCIYRYKYLCKCKKKSGM